jgi:hypothetical protein
MHPALDVNVMAHWASWRLSGGNQRVARFIVDADSRAISWLMAGRLADIVGSAVVTITMGTAAGLTLHRSRLNRCCDPRPRRRTSSSDRPTPKGVPPWL